MNDASGQELQKFQPAGPPWQRDINFTTMAKPLTKTKFKTCRYWAFGPRCPDIDDNNVDLCPYAHRDVGQLASHLEQKGTCANWLRYGRCHLGGRCFYEHRDTGVFGLYQGPLGLGGVDLEIADAASTAGFDTWNHAALYDLIWVVKRIAIKQSLPMRHPIYPDRFRPSGIGDNTNTARKRKFVAREMELQFHSVEPLIRAGGRGDPITIDSDNDDEVIFSGAQQVSKKQKISTGQNREVVHFNIARRQGSEQSPGNSIHHNDTRTRRKLAPKSVIAIRAKQNSVDEPADFISFDAESEITSELEKVRDILDQNRVAVNKCMESMREMFDVYHDRFADPKCMEMLQVLGKCLNNVSDSAEVGVRAADGALEWLRHNHD